MSKAPYLYETKIIRKYNPVYGDEEKCVCGHDYYRHFDTYEYMIPIGCKYCMCSLFTKKQVQCCCSWGAAISGEWPEFECADCEKHMGGFEDTHRCRRHRKLNKEKLNG